MLKVTLIFIAVAMMWAPVLLGPSIFAATLKLVSTITIWALIMWIWANILFLNKYSWLRDRRKYPWLH